MPTERPSFRDRRDRATAKLAARGCAALLLSPGPDLFYLTGYQVFPSERLTCLVLRADGRALVVCPQLEAPRLAQSAPDLQRVSCSDPDDPSALGPRAAADRPRE